MFGPVKGPTANLALGTTITCLEPAAAYQVVFCGSGNNGASYACVGGYAKPQSVSVEAPDAEWFAPKGVAGPTLTFYEHCPPMLFGRRGSTTAS